MTKSTAIDAIVRFAREIARLPPVPFRESFHREGMDDSTTVVQAISTDKIPGEILPRASNSWLVLLPFDDLTSEQSDVSAPELIRRRRAFLEILVKVASDSSSPFRRDASLSMRRGGECTDESKANTFWLDLFRALDPASDNDTSHEMVRCLIAMARTESLRFLLSVTQGVAPSHLPVLLEQFLEPLVDDQLTETMNAVLAVCGVSSSNHGRRMIVEIGLSLSKTKVPLSLLTVLDVLDRSSRRLSEGVELRVTTLRFARDNVLPTKSFELLGQHSSLSTITDLRLGDFRAAKPGTVRSVFNGVMNQSRGLRRLVAPPLNVFKAIASTVRHGATCIEELDLGFEPTIEHAAWLAFAFFHVDSKSCVSLLRLRVSSTKRTMQNSNSRPSVLNFEWLVAFDRALRSVTADRDLACLEDDDDRREMDESKSRRMVRLTSGTPVKGEPYSSAKLQCKISDNAEAFEAIAVVNEFVAIIVPGLGVGWVPTASIMSEECVASRLSGGPDGVQINHAVTSLTWDWEWQFSHLSMHVTILLHVLRLIGRPLTSLHLPTLRLSTEQLALVLTSCPNLTELNVSGHAMGSIAPLVDAYESGTCNIETLNVVRPGAFAMEESIPSEMTTILRGPGGRKLRQLAVHVPPLRFSSATSIAQHAEAMVTLAATLSSTDTLEVLELPGAGRWRSADYRASNNVDVTQTPSFDVCVDKFTIAPTPTVTKLAFLSCLTRQDERSALRRLDACVLALIFRFSGRRIARQVLTNAVGTSY